jgi:hypothetical protein
MSSSEDENVIKKDILNKNKAYLKAKINSLIKKGRKIVKNRSELKKCPLGSIVSYMDTQNIFHMGGFLDSIHKKYFTLRCDLTDDTDIETIMFDDIDIMYVGIVNKTKNDVISIVQHDKKKTKYPVKINDIVVYYANDSVDKDRFMNTEKYKRMVDWYEIYGNYISDEQDEDDN